LQAVLDRVADQAADHVVEIVVLDFQRLQALPNLGFFLFGQGRVGHAVKNVMPVRESYPYTYRGESPPCGAANTT